MSKAKFDPLEAAKLSSDGFKETPAAPATSDKSAVAPAAAKAPSPSSVASPPAAVALPKVKYRVLEAKRISVSGQLVDMLAGRVIDPAGYGGQAGIDRLTSQGLKLDRFEE